MGLAGKAMDATAPTKYMNDAGNIVLIYEFGTPEMHYFWMGITAFFAFIVGVMLYCEVKTWKTKNLCQDTE